MTQDAKHVEMEQPSFVGVWSEMFGLPARPVCYRLRERSDGLYDAVVMDGLLHDATFSLADMRMDDGKLIFALKRDCWELPMVQRPGRLDLYSVRSELTIGRVVRARWTFRGARVPAPNDDLEIMRFYARGVEPTSGGISVASSFPARVTLRGYEWGLVVYCDDDDYDVSLRDLDVPTLSGGDDAEKAAPSRVKRGKPRARGR